MVDFAQTLPKLRRRVLAHLTAGDELDKTRVLACALRRVEVELFRIGSEQYADDEGGAA
jgi:DNA topoisomerase I